MTEAKVRQHFLDQADACERLGSPFTARLCRLSALELSAAEPFGAAILAWRGNPKDDALALRWCGALHRLVLAGAAPELARQFPPGDVEDTALWEAARAAASANLDTVLTTLSSPPQTNETGRAAILLAVALTIAEKTGRPLDWREIGASAGLNLQFDRFAYRAGAWEWGDSSAPVTFAPDWRGAPPPTGAPLVIASRAGCDRAPVDPGNPDSALRLLSYIWADMPERLARTRAAIEIARRNPVQVAEADAADWVATELAARREGHALVFAHTVVWQYLPDATRRRIDSLLSEAGASATSRSPLARISFEWARQGEGEVHLTLWPDGTRRRLGRAHMHGAWVNWLHGNDEAGAGQRNGDRSQGKRSATSR